MPENLRLLRYPDSIMGDHRKLYSIDPIVLTRQLCEIESTTYHEGAVGDFLASFLEAKGWDVEKTLVPQPKDGGDGDQSSIDHGFLAPGPTLAPTVTSFQAQRQRSARAGYYP